MKIYTKTGDTGETSLLGGKRVRKNCIEMVAIGEIDELNASIGVVASLLDSSFESHITNLTRVQHTLFVVGSHLASVQTDLDINIPEFKQSEVEMIEQWIDAMKDELSDLTQFILPGGSPAAAQSFFARAVCRRAERFLVGMHDQYSVSPLILQYINRLSDALFTLGRYINAKKNVADVTWVKV